jgi:membrane-bound lytic murein transglycosylase F
LIKKIVFLSILLIAVIACISYKKLPPGKAGNLSSATDNTTPQYKYAANVTSFRPGNYFLLNRQPMGFCLELMNNNYDSLSIFRVSRYDEMIMAFSAKINWDWRLLASLICQESRFRPDVVSARGAYGLMQIMPETGRNFGIDIKASPENNIRAGILYINWLYSVFDPRIKDEQEKLRFILAAYNAGPGHILDAMRLAEKNGMDPMKWNGNVAVWLLKKSEPRYYTDAVVKNGFFRGRESVRFVSDVLRRYEHYKNTMPEEEYHPF